MDILNETSLRCQKVFTNTNIAKTDLKKKKKKKKKYDNQVLGLLEERGTGFMVNL